MNMSKALTIEQSAKLQKLASAIRGHNEAITKGAVIANRYAQEALAEALCCGLALREAADIIGTAELPAWLCEHCKEVSPSDVKRYVRLVKDSEVASRMNYAVVGIPPPVANRHHSADLNVESNTHRSADLPESAKEGGL
jgi:hypothetical protein